MTSLQCARPRFELPRSCKNHIAVKSGTIIRTPRRRRAAAVARSETADGESNEVQTKINPRSIGLWQHFTRDFFFLQERWVELRSEYTPIDTKKGGTKKNAHSGAFQKLTFLEFWTTDFGRGELLSECTPPRPLKIQCRNYKARIE